MPIDWKAASQNVVVGVFTAVMLGALAVFWNWGSNGGLVRALGGVTAADVEEVVKRVAVVAGPKGDPGPKGEPGLQGERGLPGESADVPRGAVMAFDRDDLDANKCPPRWAPFLEARARVIVGAGDPARAPGKMAFDAMAMPLRGFVLRQHGGEQIHKLTLDEMPRHDHPIQVIEHSEYMRENSGKYHGTDTLGRDASRIDPNWSVVRYTEVVGSGQPHNVMPPFLALFYCKKD
jgi:hypothetical protein